MATRVQLDSFYEFVSSQLDNGGAELSMDDLYSLWRAKHPQRVELNESVSAVQAAYADWQKGDAGRPARAALLETCERLGLVFDE